MNKNLKEKQDLYLRMKKFIGKELKSVFTGAKNPAIEDLIASLKKLSKDDGMIEIGNAFGDGDNGAGYYSVSLVFNLKNLEEDNLENVVYLVVKFVPAPDCGHDWDIKEFSELTENNFVKTSVLFEYMGVFMNYDSCIKELYRLSHRKYEACVKTVDAGGLSFI